MADASANELRYLPSGQGQSPKRATPNVSSGWIVMLLSGLVAAVLFLYATQQSAEKFDVAVLAHDVAPGQMIFATDFRRVEVNMDKAQLDRVIRYEDRKDIEGWIAAAPMRGGDFILKSSVIAPAAADGRRSMSIPVEKTHANSGDLRPGDRVDIIDASEEPATYVVRDVEVLVVKDESGAGLAGGQEKFSLMVAVDADQALRISRTVETGKFDVIRSTGAEG